MRFFARQDPWLIASIILFVIFLCTGLSIAHVYGASWDEFVMRTIGVASLEYVFHGQQDLLTMPVRTYGPIFEILLVALERMCGLQTMQSIFILRHIVTFIVFAISVWVFFLIGLRHFKKPSWALLCSALLVLSPRIFADSFVNSKDLPTVALMIIAIHAIIRWMDRPTFLRALWVGVASALVIDVRLTGLLTTCIMLTLATVMVCDTYKKSAKDAGSIILQTLLAVGSTIATVILLWPFLWHDTLNRFVLSFEEMSHFPWSGNVFYLGNTIPATKLPWHYIPVWILVTTPLLICMAGLLGTVVSLHALAKEKMRSADNREQCVFLCWFFPPLIAVIVLHATLYDGWRHLFFIYPALVLLAVEGITYLDTKIRTIPLGTMRSATSCIFIGIISLSLASTASWMVRHHPFQNVYFSIPHTSSLFELDYWGSSYKQGLEWLAAHDNSPSIKVDFDNFPGGENLWMLPEEDYNRFEIDTEHPRYFLTNFRGRTSKNPPEGVEIYRITVDGAKIMGVYERE